MSLTDYRIHAEKYSNKAKTEETLAILDYAEILIKIRGITTSD